MPSPVDLDQGPDHILATIRRAKARANSLTNHQPCCLCSEERKAMFLTGIGYGLTGLTGLGIIFIGARFLLAPRAAAAGFGLAIGTADTTTNAYLSVKGVRDIASGVIAFILLANGVPHLLGWFMLAASIIPFGDAITVLRHNGPKATAYGVHAATAAVMLAAAALLFT
jgi:disulfide bond formation protein DsbB